jgi:hypothetical protein
MMTSCLGASALPENGATALEAEAGASGWIIHERPTAAEGCGFNRADISFSHDFFAFAPRRAWSKPCPSLSVPTFVNNPP